MFRDIKSDVNYPAQDVWAAACAAQRVNGKYIGKFSNETHNVTLMWQYLEDPTTITTQDRELADKVRLHFQSKLLKIIAGGASSFDSSAAKISQVDFFTTRRDVAFVACLPSSYLRDVRREELDFTTQPIGKVGDRVSLTLLIDEQGYSNNYNCYWHLARQGTNRIFFFSMNSFPAGLTFDATARVKAHRSDGSTQLHHVKNAAAKKVGKKTAKKSDGEGDK